MTPLPKCLYRGFDGLDVSFTGVLPPNVLEELKEGRAKAEAAGRAVRIEIGPGRFPLEVEVSGARGGYAYRGNGGPLSGTWFFKKLPTAAPGNIRVSLHSATLAIHGLYTARQLVREALDAMGAMVVGESVGRIDFAADFQMPPDFAPKPGRFVAHANSTKREHSEEPRPEGAAIVYAGRHATSVTIGKMPGRQVTVYDKRREAIARQKLHWFGIWGLERNNCPPVWRVEVRFGKAYLSHTKRRLFTYEQVDHAIRGELLAALDAVRYLVPFAMGANVSRVPEHPLWQTMRAEVAHALEEPTHRLTAQAYGEAERLRSLSARKKLVGSLTAGIAGLEGYSAEEARQMAPDIAAECARELSEGRPDLFRAKAEDAASRYRLVCTG